MKHKRISLESLEPSGSRAFPSYAAQISTLDNESTKLVAKQASRLDAIVSMEAMARYLSKTKPSGLGATGVMFANLAFESYLEKANVGEVVAPLDVKAYEDTPHLAVSDGVDKITAVKEQSVVAVGDDLTKIVYALSLKRELFISAIDELWRRESNVREQLKKFDGLNMQPIPTVTQFPLEEKHRAILYGELGLVNKGATVVSDLAHVLTTHTHLFKRLVASQVAWIDNHKANLLKTKNGFSQYSFNPKEYQASVDTFVLAHDEQNNAVRITSSAVLPGDVKLHCETAAEVCFGYEATGALLASKTYLANAADEPVNLSTLTPLAVLSIEELQARLTEIRAGLKALRYWCDMSYCKMWSSAFYSQALITNLLATEAGSIDERGVSTLAQVTVSLLNQATKDMGQYGCLTLGGLLDYVEASAASYVTEGV